MRGLGAAKVCQLLASLELATRLARSQTRQRVQVLTPEDLAPELMLDMGRLDHEVLRVVILDTKCRVLGATDLYRGTVESASLRVPELFKEAVRANATSLVLAHNHPSGDPTPSPEDLEVTKQAVNAGRLLQIEVLDHLVIGERSFLSLRRMHPDLFA
jgi:DNA repair protein RadC